MHFVLFRTASGTAFCDLLEIPSSTRAARLIRSQRADSTGLAGWTVPSKLATKGKSTIFFMQLDKEGLVIPAASIRTGSSWLASELD